MIDTRRPRAIVRDALARAAKAIADGLSGRSMPDMAVEFLAYWEGEGRSIWSIASSGGPSRALASTRLRGTVHPGAGTWVFADTMVAARTWAESAGLATEGRGRAYLLRLRGVPALPPREKLVTLGEWLEALEDQTESSDWTAFWKWLSTVRLPCVLFFSMPAPGSPLRTLAAIELSATTGKTWQQATRGFRPGKLRASREILFALKTPLVKLRVVRLDGGFLIARGGTGMEMSSESLNEKRVVLVGCGAVGSHLAKHVAALGVGTVGLIDMECLEAVNVQRHALGVDFLGMNKAKALATALGRHFPHQRFVPRERTVEEILCNDPAFVAEADLVILALGEPTVERRLSHVLGVDRPRIHAWVEPLGVGGHVLVTGVGAGPGCYECLFEEDEDHGLRNKADLVAPSQHFDRTLAGCAGAFSPFSALDAGRTALEAADACGRVLTAVVKESVLITWRGEIGAFEREGFQLSARGERIPAGSRIRQHDFARLDCSVCRARTP